MKSRPLLMAVSMLLLCSGQVKAVEPVPNSMPYPRPILQSQTDLTVRTTSHDALALAEQLGFMPQFRRLKTLQFELGKASSNDLERLSLRQDLVETRQEIEQNLTQTRMEIDFVLAEVNEEEVRAGELAQSLESQRDKLVTRANALGFATNGALWTVAEALDIPTYRSPRLSISSGTTGILAGLVPTAFSLYALRLLPGRHFVGPSRPNMLAKIFDYPTSAQIDYPKSVWLFLTSVPADDSTGLTRRTQIINRWIEDKNMPYFKDKHSKEQLDYVTGLRQPDVTIAKIQARLDMLQQLSAEVFKMNRFLLELMMVLNGTKDLP